MLFGGRGKDVVLQREGDVCMGGREGRMFVMIGGEGEEEDLHKKVGRWVWER